ncbi:MAG: hypothetical protein ACPG77_01850 [Nannocystaceae bacterium]
MVATSPRARDWSTNAPAIAQGDLQLTPQQTKAQGLIGLHVRPTSAAHSGSHVGEQAASCTLMLRARLHWQVPPTDNSPEDLPPSIVRLRIGPYLPTPTTTREQASWIETQQLVEALRPGATAEPTTQVLWNLRYGCPAGKPCREPLIIEAEWLHATHGNLVVEWEIDATLSGPGRKKHPPFEVVEVVAKPAPAATAPKTMPIQQNPSSPAPASSPQP